MDRTFVICKPDAVERGLVGEIVAASSARASPSSPPSCARSTPSWPGATTPSTPASPSSTSWSTSSAAPRSLVIMVEGPEDTPGARAHDRWAPPTSTTPSPARSAATSDPRVTENLVHGSDRHESAAREIELFGSARLQLGRSLPGASPSAHRQRLARPQIRQIADRCYEPVGWTAPLRGTALQDCVRVAEPSVQQQPLLPKATSGQLTNGRQWCSPRSLRSWAATWRSISARPTRSSTCAAEGIVLERAVGRGRQRQRRPPRGGGLRGQADDRAHAGAHPGHPPAEGRRHRRLRDLREDAALLHPEGAPAQVGQAPHGHLRAVGHHRRRAARGAGGGRVRRRPQARLHHRGADGRGHRRRPAGAGADAAT